MNYLTVFGKTFTFATSLTLNVALWNNYFIMCAMSRFTTNSPSASIDQRPATEGIKRSHWDSDFTSFFTIILFWLNES